jgi:2-polyprenyl-6-methoxyphenol hydroxylase-like FAD-dependent oxidoreductase
MLNQTVLISGASIAGPALAYWLERYGFRVTVVEKATSRAAPTGPSSNERASGRRSGSVGPAGSTRCTSTTPGASWRS